MSVARFTLVVVAPWVLHVDLDEFVAAVEVLRRPELRGQPVVVGGDGDPTKRGAVSTASYPARKLGVHSGMPLRTAARRAPDAIFLPVDHEAYEAASAEVMNALRTFDAVVEVLGWDEAFVGVDTDDPERLARQIQRRVLADTRLHCTIGIGQNKLQAKLATGFGKPAGVFRISYDTWFTLLGNRPTDALWGIGPRTSKRLADLGVGTVAELAAADPALLAAHFGPAIGPSLILLGQGRYGSPVSDEPWMARSRSRETTFQQDIDDWDTVRQEIRAVARRVAADVVAEGRDALRIVVKVRFVPFFTRTHGILLSAPTSDAIAIEEAALAALDKFADRRPVRLLGVRAELTPPPDVVQAPG